MILIIKGSIRIQLGFILLQPDIFHDKHKQTQILKPDCDHSFLHHHSLSNWTIIKGLIISLGYLTGSKFLLCFTSNYNVSSTWYIPANIVCVLLIHSFIHLTLMTCTITVHPEQCRSYTVALRTHTSSASTASQSAY